MFAAPAGTKPGAFAVCMGIMDTQPVRRLAELFFRPNIGHPTRATLLVRSAVGSVFITSGLVKFLFDNQGPGRFAKIGLPDAPALASFVGATEIVCGTYSKTTHFGFTNVA